MHRTFRGHFRLGQSLKIAELEIAAQWHGGFDQLRSFETCRWHLRVDDANKIGSPPRRWGLRIFREASSAPCVFYTTAGQSVQRSGTVIKCCTSLFSSASVQPGAADTYSPATEIPCFAPWM